MPSTFSSLLRLELMASGENDTTWGDKTNTNLATILEAAIAGAANVSMSDANKTLSVQNGADDEARKAILNVTGTLTAARDVIVPASSKLYVVKNATTGGFAINVKTSSGTATSVANGTTSFVWCDGTDCELIFDGVFSAASHNHDSAYAAASHNHSGTYEPADATILKDADIGSTVQAYDADLTTWAGKTAPTGDVLGTSDTQTFSNKGLAGDFQCNNYSITEMKMPTYNGLIANTTTTGNVTIDWTAGANQTQSEPTGTITYTFTAPSGIGYLHLYILSDGTSTAQTINFPETVIRLDNWAAAANKKAALTFFYDGTNYWMHGSNQV